jgi:subtilisin family serine protease
MKFLSATFIACFVLSFASVSKAQHDEYVPSDTNAVNKQRRLRNRKTTRVIVSYANKAGREQAIQLSEKVYIASSSQKYLAVEIKTNLVSELAASDNINAVESDGMFRELGFLEEEVSLEEHHGRRLFQTTPYGIDMVQATQVDVGNSPVRVCMADTGVWAAHPDLPIDIMKGSNRLSRFGTMLNWRKDHRGHGSHVAGKLAVCLYIL